MAGSGELRRLARGLSEAVLRERHGSEEQCRRALFELRWGRGWCCPRCGHGRHAALGRRELLQCNRCKYQVSLTAGTMFHATKLPLVIWFQAIYHLSQSKGGISSIELGRRLGVRQPTAWLLKQKLMQAMAIREAGKPKLAGRVEIDDAYLGGERSGGKRGRGAAGKTPFVAAVETTPERRHVASGSPWSRASARRRSRSWPKRASPPAATWSAMASRVGPRSRPRAAATGRW
jgi:hypothetical protein